MSLRLAWLLPAFALLAGCHQNFRGPGEARAARARAQAQGQPSPAAAAPDAAVARLDPNPAAQGAASGPSISGTISLAPELAGKVETAGVLYVIGRSGPGPPLAVARIEVQGLPVAYRLSADHVMMPGMAFEGVLSLTARLDRDGAVGPAQPGDIEGSIAEVAVGTEHADIVLNQLHQ